VLQKLKINIETDALQLQNAKPGHKSRTNKNLESYSAMICEISGKYLGKVFGYAINIDVIFTNDNNCGRHFDWNTVEWRNL